MYNDEPIFAPSEWKLTKQQEVLCLETRQIASSKFESEINKNEQACDPNFTSEKQNFDLLSAIVKSHALITPNPPPKACPLIIAIVLQ